MASILIESYLMAYGLAKLANDTDDRAHLFARNYDCKVDAKQLQEDYGKFVQRGRELGLVK